MVPAALLNMSAQEGILPLVSQLSFSLSAISIFLFLFFPVCLGFFSLQSGQQMVELNWCLTDRGN